GRRVLELSFFCLQVVPIAEILSLWAPGGVRLSIGCLLRAWRITPSVRYNVSLNIRRRIGPGMRMGILTRRAPRSVSLFCQEADSPGFLLVNLGTYLFAGLGVAGAAGVWVSFITALNIRSRSLGGNSLIMCRNSFWVMRLNSSKSMFWPLSRCFFQSRTAW